MGNPRRVHAFLLIIACVLATFDGFPAFGAEEIKPTIWITIHEIQDIDSIEGPMDGEPEWLYKIEVWDGYGWVFYLENTTVGNGVLTENNVHSFVLEDLDANSTSVHITLFEKDTFITLLEVADISGMSGTVSGDEREPAPFAAIYKGEYHLGTNALSGDPASFEDGYYKTSGDFDGSTATDENDAELWFSIADNYDDPDAEAGPELTVRTDEPALLDGSDSAASEGSSLVSYEWDFGDGSSDTGSTTSHAYSTMGVYTVTLTVTDSIGVTATDTTTVQVLNRDPVVSFNYTPEAPTIRDTIDFVDASSDPDGEIVSWLWDFGDGATSTEQNAMHSYEDKGPFTVELTLTDNDGGSASEALEVYVVNLPPQADFDPSEGSVNVGDELEFVDESQDPEGKPLQYSWGFGDGTYSTERSPEHVYSVSGTMEVILTVTDDEGESDSKVITVIVFPKIRPEASFDYVPEHATIEDEIQFYDDSEDEDGYIASWSWEFGDGRTSSRKDTDHRYSDKGDFYVILTVTDDDGNTDSVTKVITIENIPPVADFTASMSTADVEESIQFTDGSTDPEDKPLSYQWDFGDGSTSSQQDPQHQYSEPGSYVVEMTVTDDEGASDSKSVSLQIREPERSGGIPGFPYASIAMGVLLVVALLSRRK